MRIVVVVGVSALVAGCVAPAYSPPGPIELQPYPPPVTYRVTPSDNPPVVVPTPLQDTPTSAEPLPAPSPDVVPGDATGAIPLQDMPQPAPEASSPADVVPTAQQSAAPTPTSQKKTSTAGPGSNVPLEGFRPMHGQTRPTP